MWLRRRINHRHVRDQEGDPQVGPGQPLSSRADACGKVRSEVRPPSLNCHDRGKAELGDEKSAGQRGELAPQLLVGQADVRSDDRAQLVALPLQGGRRLHALPRPGARLPKFLQRQQGPDVPQPPRPRQPVEGEEVDHPGSDVPVVGAGRDMLGHP
jgi:hypothetical protein